MEIFDMQNFLNYLTRDNPLVKAIRPQTVTITSPVQPIKKGLLDSPKSVLDFTKGMDPFIRLAGLTGAVAVALGAYGAHRTYIKGREAELKPVFETANRYHFLHTLVLLAVPRVSYPTLTGTLFITGSLLFCGPCYYYAFTGEKSFSKFAPIGGSILIVAWLTMAI